LIAIMNEFADSIFCGHDFAVFIFHR
jgi:hypothetical protein